MVKQKQQFVCQTCGAKYSKWTGKCDNCGEWNSLVEQVQQSTGKSALARSVDSGTILKTEPIHAIQAEGESTRLLTGFKDVDIVLGGGVLPGGVSLVAGQPGIGKSTLLLQITCNIARQHSVLYVSGEESAYQVKMRAERLGGAADEGLKLDFVSSTSADDIAATIREGAFQLVVVDSIQTLSLNEITSAPGSVSQITNSSNAIIRAAKETGTAVILVGHVTKEGSIAGPKVLEHLVDVVLQLDGDRYGGFKMLRAVKNRYGSTSESAIFEMSDKGMEIVQNPSAVLLSERRDDDGSVVLATIEGSRPLLVEIQALVNPTSFGYPKRTASGFDINRLNLLIAVLERRTKLTLNDKDIYINVVGGMKISDPAADLAVCMAIASAAAQRKLEAGVVVFGEIGLGGEVRSSVGVDKRVAEAKKLGFTKALAPGNQRSGKFVEPVDNLRDALNTYLQK